MTQANAPSLATDTPEALPAGMRVAEFEVRRVLGSGGFGIVYLAWDHALEREVALKEYMPGTLAGRGTGLQVSVRSKATADTFALGLRSFINEARLLARFDHPSLVKVYRFWEDNGTAYMVMPRYLGRTLRQARHAMVVPPGDAVCRRVLDALLSALEVLHREGVYHRDIAPDNILLGDDGLPVLLDFGAARRVLGDQTQALTSIMKPHYAPLEQYADSSAMRQGPWTDLYALGGTMYYLITGEVPMAAASRALHDDQPRLAAQGARGCSQGLLAAIDWMLALRPPERPQSVHMLRDVLEGRITMPGRSAADKTAPGVASREARTVPPMLRTDFDFSAEPVPEAAFAAGAAQPDGLANGSSSSNSGTPGPQMPSSAVEHLHETTVLQAHGAAPAAPPLAAPVTAPPITAPPITVPLEAMAAAAWPQPLGAPPARRTRATAARLLGALLLINLLAWWWFTRSSAPPPASAVQAEASQRTAPPDKAATAAVPVPAPPTAALVVAPAADTSGSETVLSIMPARVATPRAALPSNTEPRAATSAAVAPDTTLSAKMNEPSLPQARPRSGADPAAKPVLAAAAQSAVPGPRELCGERNFLSMLICVKRECEQPALRGHPECVKMRQQEESQRDRRQ